MILAKLKREWKTASLAVAGTVIGTWEAIAASGYGGDDFLPLIPDGIRPYTPLFFGLSFLALRKWKDHLAVVLKEADVSDK